MARPGMFKRYVSTIILLRYRQNPFRFCFLISIDKYRFCFRKQQRKIWFALKKQQIVGIWSLS